ncbi:MAG: SoxR reducing system RseC family protein [Prevotellaceae bacterium]|jgi:hypothetical protein|nr:SoxR reducing system RseC family protein [Prevotellaceae bacterium]
MITIKKIVYPATVERVEEEGIVVRLKLPPDDTEAWKANRLILLPPDLCRQYSEGEAVKVTKKESFGQKAFTPVYLLPVVALVGSLSLLILAGAPQGVAGLSSLGILALYYLALYMFRHRLDRVARYNVEKTTEYAT